MLLHHKFLILLALSFLLVSCKSVDEKRKDYALSLITKVEDFKAKNKKLPKDVSELGLDGKLDDMAYYKLISDSTYEVWYGLGLGQSCTYKSSTKSWVEN